MSDTKELLQHARREFPPPECVMESLRRRRDRKRRNQRIAAGVVGIAVFLAAVWIVTSGGVFDRTETPAVPGGAETGPAETGPAETGPTQTGAAETAPPPPLVAFGTPDVVKRGTCSDDARWRLELTELRDWNKVRFEVHRSPGGDEWHILLRPFLASFVNKPFGGRRVVASDSGVIVVQRLYQVPGAEGQVPGEGLKAEAVDRQTGQVCRASARF